MHKIVPSANCISCKTNVLFCGLSHDYTCASFCQKLRQETRKNCHCDCKNYESHVKPGNLNKCDLFSSRIVTDYIDTITVMVEFFAKCSGLLPIMSQHVAGFLHFQPNAFHCFRFSRVFLKILYQPFFLSSKQIESLSQHFCRNVQPPQDFTEQDIFSEKSQAQQRLYGQLIVFNHDVLLKVSFNS